MTRRDEHRRANKKHDQCERCQKGVRRRQMQRRRAILIKPAQAGQQPTNSGEMSSVLQDQVKLKGCGTQKAPLSTKE